MNAPAPYLLPHTLQRIGAHCSKNPGAPICGADPMYIAFTSHTDVATRILMPITNLVFPALTSDGLRILSAANSLSMHTHTDNAPGCPSGSSICFNVTSGEHTTEESIEHIDARTQLPNRKNDPFWIFNVNKDVIDGHGDVWNINVSNLVTQVIVIHPKFRTLSLYPNALKAQVLDKNDRPSENLQ